MMIMTLLPVGVHPITYRNMGATELPVPQPTSKTEIARGLSTNSGNSFTRYRRSYFPQEDLMLDNPSKLGDKCE